MPDLTEDDKALIREMIQKIIWPLADQASWNLILYGDPMISVDPKTGEISVANPSSNGPKIPSLGESNT